QIDDQKRQSCKISLGIAETDGHAERAADDRGRDPDPVPAERSGKKHRGKIGGEEYIRPDQGKTPPRRGRQGKAGGCKSDAEKRRRFGCSLPAAPKLVDPFHHGLHYNQLATESRTTHTD